MIEDDKIRLIIIAFLMIVFLLFGHMTAAINNKLKARYNAIIAIMFYAVCFVGIILSSKIDSILIPFGFCFLIILFVTNVYEAITTVAFSSVLVGYLSHQQHFLYIFITGICIVLIFGEIHREMLYGRKVIICSIIYIVSFVAFELLCGTRLNPDVYIPGIAGIIINLLLIIIACKVFSDLKWENEERIYEDINDIEYELLQSLSKQAPEEFMLSMQVSRLCQQVSKSLGLNDILAVTLGYYHRIGVMNGKDIKKETLEVANKHDFPRDLVLALNEFYSVKEKRPEISEVIVCILSRDILSSLKKLKLQSADLVLDRAEIDKVVDYVFKTRYDQGLFEDCQLSVKNYMKMNKLMKEYSFYSEI